MSWDFWNYLGTIAFAISGALIASEEDYDLIGYYALGFITAFGGGAIRNLLIGVPVSALWEQNTLFLLTFLLITVLYFIPIHKIVSWKHWYYSFGLTDAVGLVAFAIQGALYAKNLGLPASASIAAALLTGVGGGIIRDALAKRQPFVFKYELYAFWTIITGALIGLNFINGIIDTYVLFIIIVVLRMLSLRFKWHIPRPKRQASNTEKAV